MAKPQVGGLPDVIALRQIAVAFNLDPAYLLGISKVPRRPGQTGSAYHVTAQARAEWLDGIDEELKRRGEKPLSFVMDSDEMEPTIRRGALVFVDADATMPTRSGTYAVEAAGRVTVRMVETRLGGGLVLRCDNKRYAEQLTVAKEADLKKHAVRIVGHVVGWLDASWK
jgi:phage repressor protein C with HTH and peptisase S24 domain